MKGKMFEEIKSKYVGQKIYIEYLSTKFINRVQVTILPDDDFGKDWLNTENVHINKNRILLIRTADQNIWENPPEKPKYWCNYCGYKTPNPPQNMICPKCYRTPTQPYHQNRLKLLGTQKF